MKEKRRAGYYATIAAESIRKKELQRMESLRFGVIGIGRMGSSHAKYIAQGKIQGASLTAICDLDPQRLQQLKNELGGHVQTFQSPDEMFESGTVDAILIATIHYEHPPLAIRAFEKGLHVLIEKPAGVFTKNVRQMNEAAARSGTKFGIMYNQRTRPLYQKIRDLVVSGELGEIRRMNWIITDWYRSQSYYDSAGWRATWAGEGGGVLLNQAPHQLDLWQWTVGGMMPSRVRAFCAFGKWRNIEVEDDVTAYVEYPNGATGVFITSTGEAPGTNRFEISGDRGKVTIENNELTFWRLRVPESQFNREYSGGFGRPECWKCEIPIDAGSVNGHQAITQNFTDAVLKGTPMLAPGEEGILGLTLSNAMNMSTWIDDWVDLPLDDERYYSLLQEKINSSKPRTLA
jgi:predicted dehydrogenase